MIKGIYNCEFIFPSWVSFLSMIDVLEATSLFCYSVYGLWIIRGNWVLSLGCLDLYVISYNVFLEWLGVLGEGAGSWHTWIGVWVGLQEVQIGWGFCRRGKDVDTSALGWDQEELFHNFLIHSSIACHLVCFHILAIINNVMNWDLLIFLNYCFYFLGVESQVWNFRVLMKKLNPRCEISEG